MILRELIRESTAYLESRGLPSAQMQAELLLGHLLGVNRARLFAMGDRPVSEATVEALRQLLRRRAAREPLQHLVGSTAFTHFELLTTPQALIPRPETELLLEHASRWLERQLGGPEEPFRPALLDWGTGSGCLAIGLARQFPPARVTALDVSAEALELARHNAVLNGVAGQITFLLSESFAAVPAGQRFDLMVANPPYIPTEEIAQLEPEVRVHEPRLALDGGADGLYFYRRLAQECIPYLAPRGALWLELGYGQAKEVVRIFAAHGWEVLELARDYQGISRVLGLWHPQA